MFIQLYYRREPTYIIHEVYVLFNSKSLGMVRDVATNMVQLYTKSYSIPMLLVTNWNRPPLKKSTLDFYKWDFTFFPSKFIPVYNFDRKCNYNQSSSDRPGIII